MKLKISERLTQPEVCHYIDWLGSVGYRNVNCSMTYDGHSYQLMDELFALLKKLKPISKNGARSLWICAKRGTINDFAKRYGDFDELIEDETVKDYSEYEAYWRDMFPNELKWYELAAVEDEDISYQTVMLQHQQVLEQDGCKEKYALTYDVSGLIEWIIESVRYCIEALESGTYNDIVAKELPAKHRTGTILRKDFWTIYPDIREEYFKDLSQGEMDEFLSSAIHDKSELEGRLSNLTANNFFRFCTLGYAANNYEGLELSPRDQYFKHADGRDGGLGEIAPDSPEAFSDWYHNRECFGAHPWEVCRGGNSTHVDLYVLEDEGGYYLQVAGTSTWRSVEAIKFFLAIRNAGIPVVIHEADLLKDRLRGVEKIGVVPDGVIPAYCQSWFPDEDVEAFINLSREDEEKMIPCCVWQPLPQIELQ